jgi:hypothetical protein
MITALIGHRGVGKTALLKRPEILFSRREDVILSDLDFEIENRADVRRRGPVNLLSQIRF